MIKSNLFICNSIWVIFIMLLNNTFAEPIYFPDNKEPDIPKISNETGAAWKAVVVIENARFFSRPGSNIKISESPEYLEVVTIYHEEGTLYLVKRDSGQWGWMNMSDLLLNKYCQTSSDEKNPAYLKIVVKNNWRLNDGGLIQEIPFYNGPGENYSKLGSVNIFKIRYAFKMDSNRQYILVGESHLWDEDAPTACLKGWIRRDYCIAWDSQVAVYYKKSNLHNRPPAPTFYELKDLQKYLERGCLECTPENVISIENPNVAHELNADTTRFPLTDHSGNYLKISLVGDSIDKNTDKYFAKESPKYSASYVDNKRGTAYRLIYDIKNIDLMFILDATLSMDKYFRPVAEGINDFISDLKNRDKKRFKIGFSIYRDFDDGNDAFQLVCNPGDKEFESKLTDYSANTFSNERDRDFPEAVFDGIYKTIEKTNWTKDSTRAIVIIGDHGNYDSSSKKAQTTIQQIISKVKYERILLYALNVNLREKTKIFSQRFQKQMKQIIDSNKEMGELKVIVSSESDEIYLTQKSTAKFLNNIFNVSSNASEGFHDVSEKGLSIEKVRSKYGVIVTNYMLAIMEKKGITFEDINMTKFSTLCVDGWVSKKSINGEEQFDSFFLISRTKFDMLVGMLARILHKVDTSSKTVEVMIKSACEASTGDTMKENESISEYIQRVFFIPYREVSKILRSSPAELQDKLMSPTFKATFLKKLSERYEMLHFIQEDKMGELKPIPGTSKFTPVNTRSKTWWFLTASGERFCWVPFKYLP